MNEISIRKIDLITYVIKLDYSINQQNLGVFADSYKYL